MNRLVLFCSASVIAFFSALPANADDIIADSHLTSATVYTGRATLTRRATITVPAGSHTVIFNNLSASLLPDSLRAEGTGLAKVTFGALTNRLIAGAELAAPREKELQDKLLSLEDQQHAIEAEKQALTDKKTFLTTLAQQGALRTQENIASIDLKPDQWANAAKYINEDTASTLKALLDKDIALRDIQKQIQKTNEELAQLQTGQRNSYQITVPLDAAAPTELSIDLSYQIPNATWSPQYDARLNTKTGALDLIQYGSVTQNSGEDWTNIALTLSTAQPQRGTSLPDLQPFWLSVYDPAPIQTMGGMNFSAAKATAAREMMMADSAVSAPMAAPAPMEQQAEFATATIETGGFVNEYKITGASTVKADGTNSKLMIGKFDSTSKMQIQIKPQISTDAYLIANTTLKGDAPILPGQVNLFRDGAYVGQSNLPLLRPGENQKLAFGIDDQVSVKRKILKDERSEQGMISHDTVLERNFITEIQNLHAAPVEISVLETTPTSQDKQIRSEILADKTTAGYTTDTDHIVGLLNWSLSLQPKQKSDIKLGWKISWPKEKTLSGL